MKHGQSVPTESLQLWMRDLERYPPLPDAQQRELVRSYQMDDSRAGEKLTLHCLRFALAMARRAADRSPLPLEDFVAAANLGLLEALERFDPDREMPFCSFAAFRIRDQFRKLSGDLSRAVRIPEKTRRLLAILRRQEDELLGRLGRRASDDELASAMSWSSEDVRGLRALACPAVDLDKPIDSHSAGNRARADWLLPVTGPEAEIEGAGREVQIALTEAIDELPAEERRVLDLLFGLEGHAACSLGEVGRRLALSIERVSMLRARAVRRIREGPQGEILAELWRSSEQPSSQSGPQGEPLLAKAVA